MSDYLNVPVPKKVENKEIGKIALAEARLILKQIEENQKNLSK